MKHSDLKRIKRRRGSIFEVGNGQEAQARREVDHDQREQGHARGSKLKIAANAEDAKMLTLNVDSLDAPERMLVQSVRY